MPSMKDTKTHDWNFLDERLHDITLRGTCGSKTGFDDARQAGQGARPGGLPHQFSMAKNHGLPLS